MLVSLIGFAHVIKVEAVDPAANKLRLMVYWLVSIMLLAGISARATTNSKWFTRVWQIDDGLLDNTVSSVAQGPDNYLWLAMPVGVMQFDGNRFRLFRVADFVTPAASHVRMILSSRTGALWMASDGGAIIQLNPDFSAVTLSNNLLPAFPPEAWDEAGDGSLWLGYLYTDAICRIQNGQVTKFIANDGVPTGTFHTLHSDGSGNIWMAKGNQLGFFKDGKFHQITMMRDVQGMGATHTNAVWFVAEGHLFNCDTGGRLRDCGAFQNPFGYGDHPPTLLEDHTGAVWIGTDGNGLFRYNGSGFERIQTSHALVLSLTEDREGNIWAGTGGGGLDRITLSGVRLETMENNEFPFQVLSICEDANGVLWGATENGEMVSRIDGRWGLVFTNAPFAGTATCVSAGNGAVWVGTQKGKLFCLVNSNIQAWETNVAAALQMQKVPLLKGNTNYTIWQKNMSDIAIYGLLPTSEGDLWIAGENKLQCLHGGQIREIKFPKDFRIHSITEGTSNNVWIGGNGTFICFTGKRLVNRTSRLALSGHPICCLYTTDDGSIWIGSRGGGLVRYKNGRVGKIGRSQGLVDDYISQIVEDKDGWLWFGSNRGIFKIRKGELDRAMEDHSISVRPIVYGANEGLASLQAIYSGAAPYVFSRAIMDRDGCVWLLTPKGVVVADPSALSNNSIPPPVLLTQVVMDEQIIASYGGVVSFNSVTNLKLLNGPLALPPSHRHLEFDFTAFHFSAPENLHFRYQLVGFDTNWIEAGTERSANYSRLPAGHYNFLVEACVGAGQWGESPVTVAIKVIPFFWQTWWFQLSALLLFTVSVIAGVRYISFRRLQLKLRVVEQQAAVERERGRIARDIHDDLGNRLTKIQLLTGLAHKDHTTLEEALGRVRQISSVTRQATDALDEIVWAINPRDDTLPHLIDYLGQFAVEFLRTAGIRCHVDLPEHPPAKPVPAEIRHNLFLVLKESLNNIVRHAKATEVFLAIRAEEESLDIIIEDNGCGFNGGVRANGADGLENMRARVNEIGGQFQIKSSPGAGASISVRGPWLDESSFHGNKNDG